MAKDKQKPPMEYLGNGLVYRTASSTRVGVSHLTILDPNTGLATCTCEGFRSHQKCWHVTTIEPSDDDGREDWTISI